MPRPDDPLQAVLLRESRLAIVIEDEAAPSVVVMFLFAWKLIETKSPNEPMRLPFHVLPKDCAASSTTRSPCPFARAYSRSRSTGSPVRSTGMIARVRE